jgi:transposase
MSKILNVGIDISLRKAFIAFVDNSQGQLSKPFELPNTLPGAQDLEQRIISILKSGGYSCIRIGLEATNFYGFHIAEFFSASCSLAPWKPLVYVVNAKRIHDFKKAVFPESNKTDAIDSIAIAEFLRFGKLPEPYQSQAPFMPLQRLVRYRFHLVKTLTHETQYFLSTLFLKFPGFIQNKPFCSLGASAISLIDEFSLDDILNSNLEDLAAFIAKAGRNRSPNPKAIAEAVLSAARESYRIRPELANSLQLILASIIRNISALKKSIKEVDSAISDIMNGFNNPLISVPGIGPVYASGIFASIGNIHRFKSDDSLAKMAGLVWKRHQSGQFEAEDKKLIRSADKYLRYYLVEAANSLRVHNEEFKNYYLSKYKEASKHKHKRALVLTARKLVRLVFALLSNNQFYDSAKRFQFATNV